MILEILNSFKIEKFDLHHGKKKEHWIHSDSHVSVLPVSQSQDDSTYHTNNVVANVHVSLDRSCGMDNILDLPENILDEQENSPHSYVVVSSIPEVIEVTPAKEALLSVCG